MKKIGIKIDQKAKDYLHYFVICNGNTDKLSEQCISSMILFALNKIFKNYEKTIVHHFAMIRNMAITIMKTRAYCNNFVIIQ